MTIAKYQNTFRFIDIQFNTILKGQVLYNQVPQLN
jgi:hypothetical protein